MLLGSPESAIFGSLGGKYSIWATVVSGAVLAWGPAVLGLESAREGSLHLALLPPSLRPWKSWT